MYADQNILQVEDESRSFRLKFCADDALVSWAARHNERTVSSPPAGDPPDAAGYNQPPHDDLSVPYASKFQEGIQENVQRLKGWDWTFCTDYCGSVSAIDTGKNESSSWINDAYLIRDRSGTIDRSIINPRILRDLSNLPPFLFPFSSLGVRPLANDEVGIDFDVLRRRDDILFFDEGILYQGDLEDCGEVILDYKVRVMPSCWFVLLRLFLRIDNGETRIRSYRYYHNFESNKIDMNISWQLGTTEKMKQLHDSYLAENASRLHIPAGASSSVSSGVVFRGAGGAPDLPVDVIVNNFLRDANKLSEVLPSVNEAENIPRDIVLEFR